MVEVFDTPSVPPSPSVRTALVSRSSSEFLASKAALVDVRSACIPNNFSRVCDRDDEDGLLMNQLRFSSLGLYGRDSEVSELKHAYQRIRDKEASVDIVLVSGRSGTGKSAVVRKLCDDLIQQRRARTDKGCLFASGKFEMRMSPKPYTAFISAFAQLCEDILSSLKRDGRGDDFVELRDAIRDAVGSEGGVLEAIIPGVKQILEYSPDSNLVKIGSTDGQDVSETRNRFNNVIRRFINAVCCPSRPLILFLDDLQWADAASLGLLEAIVTARELSGLLLVGCFRDDEVDDQEHPLQVQIRAIENAEHGRAAAVSRITLGNLNIDSVNHLISDLLSSNKTETLGLASIVHMKTGGNVFFVKQFLLFLRDEEMLSFNFGTLAWKWNENKILMKTCVANNIVDLLRDKLQKKLDLKTRRVLQVAACLGSSFDKRMMVLFANLSQKQQADTALLHTYVSDVSCLRRSLSVCVEEGLLHCAAKGRLESDNEINDSAIKFHFAHDQIQMATFSLIPEHERDLLQAQMGAALLNNLANKDLEDTFFLAVDLFNHGVKFLPQAGAERVLRSKLNLRAGKKATNLSAFRPAATYLNMGISLLGPNHWEEHYDLSLDLFSTLAEAEYCNGNVPQMKQAIDEVLGQTQGPFNDKLRAYFVLVHSLGSHFKMAEAIETSLHVLDEMGVHIPRWSLKLAIVPGLISTRHLLKGRSPLNLADLPIMNDETKIGAMRIIDTTCTYAYIMKPELWLVLILKMVRWSVKYGLCKYSTVAFAVYGVLMTCVFGDVKSGNEFGKVALQLSEKLEAKDMEARTITIVYGFLHHWTNPHQTCMKPLLRGYQLGMETGDVETAMMSSAFYCHFASISGRPLSVVEEDHSTFCRQSEDLEQELTRRITVFSWQFVLNLMGRSKEPTVLTGEAMDQDEMIRNADVNDRTTFVHIRTRQLFLAYYFGDYQLAWKMVDATRDVASAALGQFLVWRHALFAGLTAFALARQTSSRRWKRRAVYVKKRVDKWARNGNANCIFVVQFFEAELAAVEGRVEDAKKAYNKATVTAGRYGLIHDKALALERAGEFCLTLGDEFLANHFLVQACEHYSQWGAEAKLNQLRQKHPKLILPKDSGSIPQKWQMFAKVTPV